jgi:hypothetical protein
MAQNLETASAAEFPNRMAEHKSPMIIG